MSNPGGIDFSCPIPIVEHSTVQLAHGGGGRLMRNLIEGLFRPAFASDGPQSPAHDSAVVEIAGGRLAMTTDTFVVRPLFFPGGDIGKLAVYGTVNDLAMSGRGRSISSAAFVLEEGLPMETLRRVVESMAAAAEKWACESSPAIRRSSIEATATAFSLTRPAWAAWMPGLDVAPQRVMPGDAVIVSGDLGRHGMAVMSVREGLGFESELQSDCASLAGLVEALAVLGHDLHCLRSDPRRTGRGTERDCHRCRCRD